MEKLTIALPTNDKKTLAERSGRAKGFIIYEIENKKAKKIAFRINPHKHNDHEETHDHGAHSHEDVMQILKDCTHIIVNIVGKHFKKDIEQHNIKIVKTKEKDIEKTVDEFLNKMD